MKLKILGSGNIFSKYNSASYLVDDKILIDIPNGTCKTLKNIGIEPSKISEILITHFHGDHYLDMPFLLLNKIFDNAICSSIYCDSTGNEKIYNITKLAFPNKVKKINNYFKYNYDKKFRINNYEIEKILLEHEDGIEAYGYIFNKNDLYVGFTGDSGICDNIEIMAKKCKHLICDCNSIKEKKSHMGIDNLTELAKRYSNCIFYTTHMDDSTRKELEKITMENSIILNDNDEFIF